jgi:hypothetical protein
VTGGNQGSDGALRVGGKTVDYDNIAAASLGLQADASPPWQARLLCQYCVVARPVSNKPGICHFCIVSSTSIY